MTERELLQAREAYRGRGELPTRLLAELADVASALVRFGAFPRAVAPYGAWNDEAAAELLQGWLEGKLLRGDLAALLDRARSPAAFRRMAEQSLRHWVLTNRRRSQTQNLYARLADLLRDGEYEVRDGRAEGQRRWAPAGEDRSPFSGGDRELLAAAWSVGELELVRYSSEQDKLSPVLSTPDLARFVAGMFSATETSLTLGELTRALQLRFDLDSGGVEEISAAEEIGAPELKFDRLALEETARAALAEMSRRQVEILLATERDESLEQIAAAQGCAIATVHNEQKRIGAILTRYSGDDAERAELLKKVLDLLYGVSG